MIKKKKKKEKHSETESDTELGKKLRNDNMSVSGNKGAGRRRSPGRVAPLNKP